MRYPAQQTAERHDRIIDEASRLFRAKGINGASIGEVMKACGLTHGGFYAHFASKDELVRASLERASTTMLNELGTTTESADDPKEAFLARYLNPTHRDNPEQGCAIAALAAEISREPCIRGALTTQLRRLIAIVSGRFTWKRGKTKEQQAIAFVATIVGALVLARAVDDEALSDTILSAAQEVLR